MEGWGLLDLPKRAIQATSFYLMRDLAHQFGDTSAHDLLLKLQDAAPRARFHLMGHSFGTIVVSSAVNGRAGAGPLFSTEPSVVKTPEGLPRVVDESEGLLLATARISDSVVGDTSSGGR